MYLVTYSTIKMSVQVIIPKASTSKAIVFCDGMKGRCFLSDSFNRMMELQASPTLLLHPLLPSSPLIHLVLVSLSNETLYIADGRQG